MTFSSYLTKNTPYLDLRPQTATTIYVSGRLLWNNEILNDKKKCPVLGVIADVTCSTHWVIKYFLLKIIYIGPLSVLIFYIV